MDDTAERRVWRERKARARARLTAEERARLRRAADARYRAAHAEERRQYAAALRVRVARLRWLAANSQSVSSGKADDNLG